ncbi:MAG: CbtA family protein [Haloplanus sp.]
MFTAYLARGLKAGLVAGAAFGLFVAFVATPFIAHADAVAHGGHAHGAATPASSLVATVTSVGGSVLWGLLAGAGFGVAFFLFEPAIPGGDGVRSYVLAAAGFVTVSGAPWLALPPVSPGVEAALPTRTRLTVYAGMMVAGLVACLLAGAAQAAAHERHGRTAGVVVGAVPLAALPLVAALAPGSPAGTTSALSAAFRGVVVLGQVGLWAVLGGTHAWLRRRERSARRQTRAAVTAD